MSKELRVAILGGGRMAAKHATAIRLQPGARFVAVSDPYVDDAELRSVSAPTSRLSRTRGKTAGRGEARHRAHRHAAAHPLPPRAPVPAKPAPTSMSRSRSRSARAKPPRSSISPTPDGLRACAAHQVLFQRAGQLYQTHLPMIGELIHVESYFSFKPVRRRPDGGTPLSAVDQLIDILPHPVYLLLSALEQRGGRLPDAHRARRRARGRSARGHPQRSDARDADRHACAARPVESYLRVVGSNGSVTADFILGDVVQLVRSRCLGARRHRQAVQPVAAEVLEQLRRRLPPVVPPPEELSGPRRVADPVLYERARRRAAAAQPRSRS